MAEFGDLSSGSLTVRASGQILDLTPYEYRVLCLLIEDAAVGKPLTTLASLALVAPPATPGTEPVSNVLQVIVYRIRRKLLNAGSVASILTVRARGYSLSSAARGFALKALPIKHKLPAGVQVGNADLVPAQHQTLGSSV